MCAYVFRQGLKGKAKAWHADLDSKTKRNWTELQRAFREEFNNTESDTQIYQDVLMFDRRTGETMGEFCSRAERIAKRCNDVCKKILANNLMNRMVDGKQGKDTQRLVTSALMTAGKIKVGQNHQVTLKPEATFEDMRDAFVAAMSQWTTVTDLDAVYEREDDDPSKKAMERLTGKFEQFGSLFLEKVNQMLGPTGGGPQNRYLPPPQNQQYPPTQQYPQQSQYPPRPSQ